MNSFATLWETHYPGMGPTGWLMRAANARWWIRFHSLPLSKRYAETDEERGVILDRQNTLAAAVLGEDEMCWMAQTQWLPPDGYVEISDENEAFRETDSFGLQYALTFTEEDDEEARSWKVMAALLRWKHGAFDETLLRIADDIAAPTMWVSAKDGAVFAPYDGGVDLFLPSEAARDDLRERYGDWLSSYPGGM